MPMQGAPSYDDKKLGREIQTFDGGPNPETEDRVMLLRNRVSRIYYKHKFFDYPVSLKPQTLKNMGFASTMKAGTSYLISMVHKLPEDSLENFYINRFGNTLYQMFFEGYTEKLWGKHPSEISADWGSQRVKGLSISAVLKDVCKKIIPGKNKAVETSLIEEFWYPKYGPGQLWETVADEIKKLGGEIRMNCSVEKVVTENNKVTQVIYHSNDELVVKTADIVISSMPIKDLVAGMNDVPENVQEVAAGLPYRDFVTVGLLVDRLKIKNETKLKTLANIVPDCWIYVQDAGVKLGRIQIFNNWSPYMVSDVDNKIWIGLEYFCFEGDGFWNMTDEDRSKYAVKELVKMGVLESEEHVFDYHCEKVKKAYPAYFDTYNRMNEVVDYLNQFDNLYCVGRNGQHRYNNMDHSMVTSFEAVKNIYSGEKDKTNIWNVNTEKEYHEEKA